MTWMIGFLILTAVTLTIALFTGNAWWAGTAVVALILLAGWVLRRAAFVRIPEMEIGVVYDSGGRRFARFLPPGNHWLRPFAEQLTGTIATDSTAVQGRTHGLQTIGGLSLSVEWRLVYDLNPLRVPSDRQAKVARTLSANTAATVRHHVGNVLQHIISEYTIERLTRPGAPRQLEVEVKTAVDQRLRPLGFEIGRVMINAIELPPHVKAALETAHERQMQAENEAQALARLQQVVSQFSDADMQRLIELERIRHIGQHGVIFPYPTLTHAVAQI
jgi:regulator of protease activity HflC (stomatin/prohibitin superfamily)